MKALLLTADPLLSSVLDSSLCVDWIDDAINSSCLNWERLPIIVLLFLYSSSYILVRRGANLNSSTGGVLISSRTLTLASNVEVFLAGS